MIVRSYPFAAALLLVAACSGNDEGDSNASTGNEKPVSVIQATPLTGIPPLSVYFDGTKSSDLDGKIISYAWNFGDGATSKESQTEHTYRQVGAYAVTLDVVDNEGGSHKSTITVTATRGASSKSPTADFVATPMRGAVPLFVSFDAVTSSDPDGAIVLHVWDLGDGTQGTGQQYRHTYEDLGIYDVKLTVFDNDGLSDESTLTIRVTEEGGGIPPEARFTVSSAMGFAPLTIDFDASSSDPKEGTITSFVWDFKDGASGNGALVSHTYSTSGVYWPELTVTNDGNLTATSIQRIVVRGADSLPFSDDYAQDRGWIVVEEGTSNGPSNWLISNGQLVQSSNIGGGDDSAATIEKPGTHVYYGNPAWTDYDVSVNFTSPDNDSVGIMARYIDDDNFYRFSVDTERGFARIVAKQNGNYHLLAEDLSHPGYTPNANHSLRLSVDGSLIEAYFDSALVLTATDTRHAAGAIGLYCWYSDGVRFDDLLVSAP
jgi:PKD repeat protein